MVSQSDIIKEIHKAYKVHELKRELSTLTVTCAWDNVINTNITTKNIKVSKSKYLNQSLLVIARIITLI